MDSEVFTFQNGASYLDTPLLHAGTAESYTISTVRSSEDGTTPEITSILSSHEPRGAIDWKNDSISIDGISYPVQVACTRIKQSQYWALGQGRWRASYQEPLHAWKIMEFIDSGNENHDSTYTGNSASFDAYQKRTFGRAKPATITTKGIKEKDIPAVILILIYSEIRRLNTPKDWDETTFRWFDKMMRGMGGWSGAVRTQT